MVRDSLGRVKDARDVEIRIEGKGTMRFLTAVVAALVTLSPVVALEPGEDFDAQRALSWVQRLADDELQGRRTGTAAGDRAADLMAATFREAGLEPAGDNGDFLQSFTFPFYQLVHPNRMSITTQGSARELTYSDDFYFLTGSGQSSGTADILYVGYGLSAAGYDDLRDVDPRGKVLLAMEGMPTEWSLDRGLASSISKARQAHASGAAGILFFPDPERASAFPRTRIWSFRPENHRDGFFVGRLNPAVADELLDGQAAALKNRILRERRPASRPTGEALQWECHVELDLQRRGATVLGLLRGSSVERSSEVVIVGAHYDGGGQDPDGTIYNGAEDNASGASVVLELARAMASGKRPARSVLFAGWGAEEQGAHGSQHFLATEHWPLEEIVAVFTLDNVGAGSGRFRLFGARNFPEEFDFLAAAVDRSVMERFTPRGLGGSDGWYFQIRGIPSLFAHADAPQPYVHSPQDDAETISLEMLDVVGRFVQQAAFAAADAPEGTFVRPGRLPRYLSRHAFVAGWARAADDPDWQQLSERDFDLLIVEVGSLEEAGLVRNSLPSSATVVTGRNALSDTEAGAPLRVVLALRGVPPRGTSGADLAAAGVAMLIDAAGPTSFPGVARFESTRSGLLAEGIEIVTVNDHSESELAETLGAIDEGTTALLVDISFDRPLSALTARLLDLGLNPDRIESLLGGNLRAHLMRSLLPQ